MDARDPAVGGEQRRGVTTEDLVEWAHRQQRPEEGAARPGAPEQDTAATDQPVGGREATAATQPEQRPARGTAELAGDRAGSVTEQQTPLFQGDQVQEYRSRWTQLQVTFVDEPRRAVQQADELVAEVMQTLAATFADHKRQLESQWRREGQADTEELRLALRRYRAFFDQLLRG